MYEKLILVFLVLAGFSFLSAMLFGFVIWLLNGCYSDKERFFEKAFDIAGRHHDYCFSLLCTRNSGCMVVCFSVASYIYTLKIANNLDFLLP